MKHPGRNRKIQYWPFFFFFIGGTAIFGALVFFELFGRWEPLASPISGVDSLVTFRIGDLDPYLVAANADGAQILCYSMDGGCKSWQIPQFRYKHSEEYGCNFKHFRFTLGHLSFNRVVDCIEDRYTAGGYGTERYVVVLDDHHQLWLWNNRVLKGTEFIGWAILFIPLCFGASFITALIWNSLSILLFPGVIEKRTENRKAFLQWLESTLRIGARVGSIAGLVYVFFVLVDFNYPFPEDFFWNIVDNPRKLFLAAIALCTLVAWGRPLLGAITGLVCILIAYLKLGTSHVFSEDAWFALVLLAFIVSVILRTQRANKEKEGKFPGFTLLFFFFFGLVLAIILAAITQSGLIGYWQQLMSLPEKASGLITIRGLDDLSPDLVVSSGDGNQYECITSKFGYYKWEQIPEEMSLTRQAGKYACNLTHPRFTIIARPFYKVEDCLEILFSAAGLNDASRYVFVLDDQGNIWAGTFDEDKDRILSMVFSILPTGLLASFSTALGWSFLSSRSRQNRRKQE